MDKKFFSIAKRVTIHTNLEYTNPLTSTDKDDEGEKFYGYMKVA